MLDDQSCLLQEIYDLDAKIAKLTEALKTLEKEHRHQSECWSLTEDCDQSEYHKKWADFCSKALEEE